MWMLLLACPPKHPAGKRVQLESFEYAHARIEEAHYDEDMNGLDWDAVYDELAPQARKARTNAELRPILEDMFGRLGDSHYSVLPLEVAEGLPTDDFVMGNGVLDLDIRVVDDQVLVLRSGVDGVQVGWVLESLGDTNLAEWRQARAAMDPRALDFRINSLLTTGLTGTTTTLQLRDHDDNPVQVQATWAPNDQLTAQIGNLPPFGVNVRSERVHDDVHLFAINAFMPPIMDPWAEAVAGAANDGVSGLIIDLRGNPGGVSGLSVGMASYLVSQPGQVLGTMVSRDSTFNFLVTPRPPEQRFDGAVAVLIDRMSASTSEILAGGLKGIQRARVFGDNSAGMALPSTFETLPNGDRLQLVLADLVGPDGERLEGSGVEPHERIPLSRDTLKDGDPVIAAAISWIVEDEE